MCTCAFLNLGKFTIVLSLSEPFAASDVASFPRESFQLVQARKKLKECKDLPRLTVLAHLTALPKAFGENFPKLTHLFLSNNHISHCPETRRKGGDFGSWRPQNQEFYGGTC